MDFSGQPMFLSFFAGQGVLDKDPRVWLDGAKPPLIKFNYECSKVIKYINFRFTSALRLWLQLLSALNLYSHFIVLSDV
jgi:hypothetical protein